MSGTAPGRLGAPGRHTKARKRFGQHFLRDRAVIRRIVAAIAPRRDELIVEIGPGRGALTLPLLESGCELHVIEIDRDLVAALRALSSRHPNLTVHEADALAMDLARLAPAPQRMRVTGNLPYNISTPLLFRLLVELPRIRDMHLMLQREVVDRMVSPPGSRTYGRLSVMVQLDCETERILQVGPGAFSPAPRVDSTIVRLRPRPRTALEPASRGRFDTIVRSCFSKRRKTLRNALRGLCDESAIAAAGLDPRARPETLPVEAFVQLARASMGRERHSRSGAGELPTVVRGDRPREANPTSGRS